MTDRRDKYRRLKASAVFAAVIGGLLAAAVGCVVQPPESELAARRAADQLEETVRAYNPGAVPVDMDFALFSSVYQIVQRDYVYPVDSGALINAAASGVRETPASQGNGDLERRLDRAATAAMLASLDPYSLYMDKDAFRSLNEETKGAFGGLGIEINKRDGRLTVVSPIEGTPAFAADLQPGDVISRVDGVEMDPLSLREAVVQLRGAVGTDVTLTIERKGRPPFDVRLTRSVIHVNPVRWHTEGDVGYIRVTSFSQGAGGRVAEAVAAIKGSLGNELDGFVLDLRNNPGGLLTESIRVSGVFIDGGPVVSTKSRWDADTYDADNGDRTEGVPLVVLINEGSASASEIVAGAIQDRKRGLLLGDQSYGKGSVQSVFPLGGGDGLKLTTAHYFTPSGRTVEGGIMPDRILDQDEGRDGDEQLEEALRLVTARAAGHAVTWGAEMAQ